MRAQTSSLGIAFLSLAACASLLAQPPARVPDPRVGLRPGWMNAGEAASHMRLVSTTPPAAPFMDASAPGDFRLMNSDLAFVGSHVIQGNFSGLQVWNIADPRRPTLVTAYVCPGAQNDVSVHRHLLFVSVEAFDARVDCGTQGIPDSVSRDRMRGIRIFDISDIARPRPVALVQTCRGSHTHTLVTDPADTANVYIYVSGAAPVRSPNELAGCSAAHPAEDPASSRFRIEVIQVPLAAPQQARIVSSPRIFANLSAPAMHGAAPEDSIVAAREAAAARARGAFVVTMEGLELPVPDEFARQMLDSVVTARGGSGTPTGADSAALRAAVQGIVERMFYGPPDPSGARPGPEQCHDITVYSGVGLAGGACGGYGLLLDIRDVKNPRRIAAVADSNFAYWHSATFNNDGTKVLFTDEWGGGLQPKCRATDRPEWGANAIFTRVDSTLRFVSYYKIPAAQTSQENCVAHNGSLIPVPGRDIMVQGWYQGGVSVLDWTDPAHPVEIAYFDRGPMDSTRMLGAGSWSAYWYNGYIVSSEIARGLDILELTPGPFLSQNEIDAARLVRFDYLNVQNQPRLAWPPSFVVVRAYLDQLERSNGLAADRLAAARTALAAAERAQGQGRRQALTQLATRLERDAATAGDAAKVRMLAAAVRALADART